MPTKSKQATPARKGPQCVVMGVDGERCVWIANHEIPCLYPNLSHKWMHSIWALSRTYFPNWALWIATTFFAVGLP
jgi:hypothetical protein